MVNAVSDVTRQIEKYECRFAVVSAVQSVITGFAHSRLAKFMFNV